MPVITRWQEQTIRGRWIQRFQTPVTSLPRLTGPTLVLFAKELINGC